jgi:AhpD family alkylhydroperoxidase
MKEDMKGFLEEFNESVDKWQKNSPSQLNRFMALLNEIEKPSALDTKTKELIAISLSVISHCKWCISFHVKAAFDSGATNDEIRDAGWVAVLMGGGPPLAYNQLVEDAIEDFGK